MADDNDTPPAPSADQDKPAPRRRAPRKAGAAKPGPKPRGVVASVEDNVVKSATAAKDAVTDTAAKAVKAVKPRSTKRATPRPAAKKTPAKKSGGKSSGGTLGKVGGAWGAAAIAGGVAAAAGAALLTLRGSSSKNLGTEKKPIDVSGSGDKGAGHPQKVHTAHQADGTDSSKSFNAGIADEGTIPGKE